MQCCIVGCGPAGAMLGLLLARRGVEVTVLEKHADFLIDFRGDDIAAGTMEIIDQLGLADGFFALNPKRVNFVDAYTPMGKMTLADLSKVKTPFPFVAVVPQWDFLSFITSEAARYPGFRLMMRTEATGVVAEDGRVRGVRYRSPDGEGEILATLTVAADGRDSTIRKVAGMPVIETAPPIDALLFQLPRTPGDQEESAINIHLGAGWAVARLDRGDYWQTACVIRKGAADEIRAAGMPAFRETVQRVMPDLAKEIETLEDWKQVHLLSIQSNRLRRWYIPGLLCIGDAAHAMSPIGGTGINFAIQDAVVAGNLLAGPLKRGEVSLRKLAAVQRKRAWQVRVMQVLQGFLTKGILIGAETVPRRRTAVARTIGPKLLNLPGFCALRSRLTALGLRRVRVAKPRRREAIIP